MWPCTVRPPTLGSQSSPNYAVQSLISEGLPEASQFQTVLLVYNISSTASLVWTTSIGVLQASAGVTPCHLSAGKV